jgi:hypothetical protein
MILKGEEARGRESSGLVCDSKNDLLIRRGQPGLAFGEHDTYKKRSNDA